jgi:hypothetical protein
MQTLEPRRLLSATLNVVDINNNLLTLDTATGTLTPVHHLYATVGALAESPSGQFYAVHGGDFPLYSLDNAGNATLINYLSYTTALAFSPAGVLYAANTTLDTVNTTTGAESAGKFFSTNQAPSGGSLAFDGQGDLYMVDSSNKLELVNPATAAAGVIGPTGFAGIIGIAFGADGTLYGVVSGSGSGQVISINPQTGAGTLVSTYSGATLDAVTAIPSNSNIPAPPFPPSSPPSSPPPPPASGGLTPTIIHSTVPAAIVGGSALHGAVTLSVTNSGAAADISTAIGVYATADGVIDGNSILVGQFKPRLNVPKGRTLSVPVMVNSTAVTAGTYTLLAQAVDTSSNVVTSTPGPTLTVAAPFLSFSETVTLINLAGKVVSGTPSRAMAKVVITNHGNIAATPSQGTTTVAISASPTSGVAGTTINSLSRPLNIRANGGTAAVLVPFKSLPALTDNDYFIVASVTDPLGGSSIASSAATTNIAAPFITLAATFGNLPRTALTAGAPLVITNSGNVDDSSVFTATIGFATDINGTNIVGTTAGILVPARVTVRAGKTATIHVTGWKNLVAPGTHFLTVTLTDASGNTVTAISLSEV